MSITTVNSNALRSNLSFNGVSLKAAEISEYKTQVPLDVAKAAIKDDGLDEVIFEVEGKTYISYGDGLNFDGLKKDGIPASIFKGNLPFTVQGEFRGQAKDIKILHIDNEDNTAWEGAKKLFPIAAVSQALPTGIQVALAPAAAKAAEHGTNLMAKVTCYVGNFVTKAGDKMGVGPVGVGVAVGAVILAAGVAGGAIYYGHVKGEDYKAIRGLIKD